MLFKLLILFACALPLSQSLGIFLKGGKGDDLSGLCANKTINLSRMSHLESLIKQLDNDHGGECVDNTEAALRDLKNVADSNKGKECTMDAFERYKAFYLRYLDTSDKGKKDSLNDLPASLRNFAIAYGLQLSGLCRTNMVNTLLDEGRKLVTEDDFDEVGELIAPDGPMALAIGYTGNRPDEIITPGDFMIFYGKENQEAEQKINLKVKTTPLVKRVQTLCNRRFKPIYGPLMMPVSQFTNLGFDHRLGVLKKVVEETLKNKETDDLIGRWSRVVFMCETLTKIELVETIEDRELSDGNDATQVLVRSKDQSDDKITQCDAAKNLLDDTNFTDLDDIEQVEFNPALSIDMPDEIMGTWSQKSAVQRVNTDRDEQSRMKLRMITKVLRKMKSEIKKYRHLAIIKVMLEVIKNQIGFIKNSNKAKQTSNAEVSTNLVQALNGLVDQEMNPDRAVKEEFTDKQDMWCGIFAIAMIALIALLIYDGHTFYTDLFTPSMN